jgi:hypothetical protein
MKHLILIHKNGKIAIDDDFEDDRIEKFLNTARIFNSKVEEINLGRIIITETED